MKIHCSYTELADPKSLKPNPKNPNRHSASQIALLAGVLEQTGWRQPITLSKRSGLVVRGHGRLEAALLLGFDQVPVDRQEYASEAEELADLVADNRLSELAELDEDALSRLLRELQGVGHDLQLAGFTEADVAKLLNMEVETAVLEPIPAMEIQAFEHYDYLCFMFRDIRDWLRALQLLRVGRVNYSISRRTQKIGVGRVLDGERLLTVLAPQTSAPLPHEPVTTVPPARPDQPGDPSRDHEPRSGQPSEHAPARPSRHARRARGRG